MNRVRRWSYLSVFCASQLLAVVATGLSIAERSLRDEDVEAAARHNTVYSVLTACVRDGMLLSAECLLHSWGN